MSRSQRVSDCCRAIGVRERVDGSGHGRRPCTEQSEQHEPDEAQKRALIKRPDQCHVQISTWLGTTDPPGRHEAVFERKGDCFQLGVHAELDQDVLNPGADRME